MHFEDIWNMAEKVSKESDVDLQEAFSKIKMTISSLEKIPTDAEGMDESRTIIFGELLFNICVIAREHNINSAAALASAIEDARSEREDPDDQA